MRLGEPQKTKKGIWPMRSPPRTSSTNAENMMIRCMNLVNDATKYDTVGADESENLN